MANFMLTALAVVLGTISVLVFLTSKATYLKRVNRYTGGYDSHDMPAYKRPASVLVLAILAGIIFIASFCFKVVPTGYTGVRTTFGMISEESCMPGFKFVAPFAQHISLVNNKQQDLRFTERVWSETKEQTVVYMENVVVTYQIVPEASAWIYANVENWVEELVDTDIVSSSLKAASRKLGADNVTDRSVIEPAGKQELQASVDQKYGENRVIIKNVIINNMDFEDSYNAAIARKSEAIQQQQEQAIRNKTNIEQATAEAEAARVAAQGKADAALIEAEGKAKANEIISNSITEATQRQDAINKWNGELPKYVSSGNGLFGILENAAPTVPTE